jgi:hypothetical protein
MYRCCAREWRTAGDGSLNGCKQATGCQATVYSFGRKVWHAGNAYIVLLPCGSVMVHVPVVISSLECGAQVESEMTGGNRSNYRETHLSATVPTTNPTWSTHGVNPGRGLKSITAPELRLSSCLGFVAFVLKGRVY